LFAAIALVSDEAEGSSANALSSSSIEVLDLSSTENAADDVLSDAGMIVRSTVDARDSRIGVWGDFAAVIVDRRALDRYGEGLVRDASKAAVFSSSLTLSLAT
jgi:hypothetical protein